MATFLLQKGAKDWSRIVESKRGDVGGLTWDEFKKAFQDKYAVMIIANGTSR